MRIIPIYLRCASRSGAFLYFYALLSVFSRFWRGSLAARAGSSRLGAGICSAGSSAGAHATFATSALTTFGLSRGSLLARALEGAFDVATSAFTGSLTVLAGAALATTASASALVSVLTSASVSTLAGFSALLAGAGVGASLVFSAATCFALVAVAV